MGRDIITNKIKLVDDMTWDDDYKDDGRNQYQWSVKLGSETLGSVLRLEDGGYYGSIKDGEYTCPIDGVFKTKKEAVRNVVRSFMSQSLESIDLTGGSFSDF